MVGAVECRGSSAVVAWRVDLDGWGLCSDSGIFGIGIGCEGG